MPLDLTPEQMAWVGLTMLAPCTIVCTVILVTWTYTHIIKDGLTRFLLWAARGSGGETRPDNHGPLPTPEEIERFR